MMLAPGCRILTLGLAAALALGAGCGGGNKLPKRDSGTGGGVGTGGEGGGSGGTGFGGSGGRGGTGGGGGGGAGGGGTGGGGAGGTAGRDGGGGDGTMTDAAGGTGGTTDGAAPDMAAPDVAAPDMMPDAPPTVFSPPMPPWQGRDIGTVGPQVGGAALQTMANNGQMFDVIGGGTTGIGGTADSLFFMYQQVPGDGVVQGRLFSMTMADANSAAGFMIRESLDPDAAMVFVGGVGDGMGGRVIVRRAKGQAAVAVPMDGVMASLRPNNNTVMRLVRVGSTIRVYAGASNAVETDATLVGGGMVELTLANPNAAGGLFYGGAVSAAHATMPATARFNEISVHNMAAGNATADWTHYNVGSSGASAIWTGSGNAARLTMTALGQPWGAVMGTFREFVGFAYLRNNESNSIRFLVTSQGMTDPASRVAAMIRDVNGFSRAAVTIILSLTQGNGLELGQRMTAGEANELVKLATVASARAPLWLRLDKAMVVRPGDPLGTRDTFVTAFWAEDNNGNPRDWQQLGPTLGYPTSATNLPAHGIAVSSFVPASYHKAEISRVQVMPAPPPPTDGGASDAAPAGDAAPASDAAPSDGAAVDAVTSG
jgi:hypothetical protein